MSSGRVHAIVGIASCVIAWLIISTVHLFWSGLFISLIFGAILAKFPDLDIDIKIIWGHRNPIFHSALLPGLILLAAVWVNEFSFLSLSIYWCIAHGSHLLADIGGKASHGVTGYFLFLNGSGLLLVGILAGVWMLI